MVDLTLLFVSGLFFLAVSAALYVAAWIAFKVFVRCAPHLQTRWARPCLSACLLLPSLTAGAFTAGGVLLRHQHASGKIHHDVYCGDIALFLAVPEGKLPVIMGLAVQGMAWLLLAWGVCNVVRLWHATFVLERGLSPYFLPPSDKLGAALAKLQHRNVFAGLQFFEADIPMAYSCLIGVLHIRCVLSKDLVASSTSQELEAVVMHEVHHFRSGDVWRTLLVGTLNCLFFYLRPVGLLARHWREETELACDAATAGATREPLALASAILRTQGVTVPALPLPSATPSFAEETACAPEKRVERLLAYAQGASSAGELARFSPWHRAITTVLTVLGVLTLLSPQAMCVAHCSLEAIARALH